jgi:Tfp pilus assembly protein PilV
MDGNGAGVGRIGVLIAGLVLCVAVTACSPSRTVALKKTMPSVTRVSTETVQVGRLTEIFATPLPADSASKSVVQGFRSDMILWDKSDEDLSPVAPTSSFVTGAALAATKASDVVPSGTDRLFKTSVSAVSDASATVTTCDDGSKFEQVNTDTGVPDPEYSASADEQYVLVTWQMTRAGGRWLLSAVSLASLPNSQAKPCQPLGKAVGGRRSA